MSKKQRKKLVVEPEIQYALVRQLCLQWALHLVASLMLLTMLQVLLGGYFRPWSEHFQQIWPTLASVAVSLAVLAPVYIRNSLKLSNRFVGPIHRFRQQLRDIAKGESHQTLRFREMDYWPTIAEELDGALTAMQQSTSVDTTNKGVANDGVPGDGVPGGGVTFPENDGTTMGDSPVQ